LLGSPGSLLLVTVGVYSKKVYMEHETPTPYKDNEIIQNGGRGGGQVIQFSPFSHLYMYTKIGTQ
jgi:hypothetical protein